MEAFLALLKTPVFWLLTVMGITALVLLYHGYRKIKLKALENVSYSRSFSEDGLFMGETMEMTETIRNPGWLPLFRVKLTFYLPAGLTVDDTPLREYTEMTSVFNIPPFGVVTKKHTLRADKRGHFIFGSASIHYFGCEFEFQNTPEFHAYPAALELASGGDAPILRAGNMIASRKYIEDPFFPVGIREYRPGDSIKSVHVPQFIFQRNDARSIKVVIHSLLHLFHLSHCSYLLLFVLLFPWIDYSIHYQASFVNSFLKLF